MQISRDWAYLVGVFLGDGCVTTNNGRPVFRLNTIDRDFATATKAALSSLTGYAVTICTHSVKKSAKPNHSLSCGDAGICAALNEATANKTKLPDWIFAASDSDKLAFIAGLMDSEGYVCLKHNRQGATLGFKSTDVWFDDFLALVRSVGIEHGKVGVEAPRQPHYRTPRRISIKLRSWVEAGAYFNIARKQERVERWAKMPRYGRLVASA